MKNDAIVRYQKVMLALFLALIVLFFSSCDIEEFVTDNGITTVVSAGDVQTTLYGPYDVVRVVDGDTIILSIDSKETKVRMIGIDTPESVHPDKNKNSDEGIMVSDFTKKQLIDKSVYLEYDEDREDDYGRTLAYVYLDKNLDNMYQNILLEKGYASVMIISPNVKYADHFRSIAAKAKKNKVGLWAYFFSE